MKKADHNGSQKIPHYQRIARQLKSAIERGELAPGSRLPASRVYAQEQGVSRATIENAGELVAQGWLERRGQAGPLSASGSAAPAGARSAQRGRAPRRRCRFRWGCRRWISFRAGCGRG
jgi:DNA-binding transcriptional MocR family regulator